MLPFVRVRLPDGSLADLEHGDLIGRVATAALPMDDPRVSEAHALVSLREGRFHLLALRRMLAVDGQARSEVRLEAGVVVELADGLGLEVVDVALPTSVWVLETLGLPRTTLPSVVSLWGLPGPKVVGRWDPEAPGLLWASPSGWRLRCHGAERILTDGAVFEVEGHSFRVRDLPLDPSDRQATLLPGGVHAPLLVVASFDSVQIHRDGEPVLVLSGVAARLVSELAAMGGPVSWRVVASQLWRDDADDLSLRRRWDVCLVRLRARLRAARVRPDLIRSDGSGVVELVLRPEDRLEDRT